MIRQRDSPAVRISVTRGIADYVGRYWAAVRAAKADYWAARIRRLGPREGLRIADELRRQMLAIDPKWPSEAERRKDLAAHVRMAELLRRADRAHRGCSSIWDVAPLGERSSPPRR